MSRLNVSALAIIAGFGTVGAAYANSNHGVSIGVNSARTVQIGSTNNNSYTQTGFGNSNNTVQISGGGLGGGGGNGGGESSGGAVAGTPPANVPCYGVALGMHCASSAH
jgi:hypothetical protein